MRIAVLASGEGTTLQAILDAIRAGTLSAEVSFVLSNNRDSGALSKAQSAGLPSLHISRATHPDERALDLAMCKALEDARTDVVVTAGYMRKIGPKTLKRFAGVIVNTHPSLLPKYGGPGMYGRRVHEAVLESGDAESGVSVHLVDAEYDSGPIIAQIRLELSPGETVDTLEAKVRAAERNFLCEVLQQVAKGEVKLRPNCRLDRTGG